MKAFNKKRRPKHATKMKYKIDKFNWIFMYQKSCKNRSIKCEYNIYEKYAEWNMDSNSEWIFGEDYYQRPFYYKEFYWYAAVPKEFVKETK